MMTMETETKTDLDLGLEYHPTVVIPLPPPRPRFSQAMREGALLTGRAIGRMVSTAPHYEGGTVDLRKMEVTSCAAGAAYVGLVGVVAALSVPDGYGDDDIYQRLVHVWPELTSPLRAYPSLRARASTHHQHTYYAEEREETDVITWVIDMNDFGKMTREEIADTLECVGL